MKSLTPEITDVINSIQNLSGTNRPYRAVKLPWDNSVYGSFVLPEEYSQFMQPQELHAESVLKADSLFYEIVDENGPLTEKLNSTNDFTTDVRNSLGQYAGKRSLRPIEGLTFTTTISLPPPTAPAAVAVAACLLAKHIDCHVYNIQNALNVIHRWQQYQEYSKLETDERRLSVRLNAYRKEPYHKDENQALLTMSDTIYERSLDYINLIKYEPDIYKAKPSYNKYCACFTAWQLAIRNACMAVMLHSLVTEQPDCAYISEHMRDIKLLHNDYEEALFTAKAKLTKFSAKCRRLKGAKCICGDVLRIGAVAATIYMDSQSEKTSENDDANTSLSPFFFQEVHLRVFC